MLEPQLVKDQGPKPAERQAMSQRRSCTLVFWAVAWVRLAGESERLSAAEPDTPSDGSTRVVAAARDNWVAGALRDEIRPEFAHQPRGGPDGQACLIIKADQREGLDGFWKKVFPVTGGKTYRFQASYQAKGDRRAAAEHRRRGPLEGREGPAGPAG